MAALPPRQSVTSVSRPVRQSLTALQTLLQMGFPKHRVEKALAATGDRGVQLAADWLLAHVNDSTLDDNAPREYILYLCPTGPLLNQLDHFFQRSLTQCGRNGAHNYVPHITLCSFFQAPDDSVHHLIQALKKVVEELGNEIPDKIHLDHYTSPTFLGLFVAEEHNDLLKRVAMHFMRDVSEYIMTEIGALDVLGTCFPWCSSSYPSLTKGGSRSQIQIEPYLKALHVTLAYQFLNEHYPTLENLLREVDTTAPAGWELRLYSRDTRIKGNEVHKVLYSHVPKESDELDLLIGDYVYVSGDQLSNCEDGWVEGVSWLTGCTGFLPKNYIERTAESDAWTLHKSIVLSKNSVLNEIDETLLYRRPPVSMPKQFAVEPSNQPKSNEEKMQPLYENIAPSVQMSSRLKKEEACKIERNPRQLFVFRHAERVDFTFGEWISMCFDATGKYRKKDLNMPNNVPPRSGGPNDYSKDSPLTKIGLYQATLTGEAVKESGVSFSHIYCSPSLRCVQTCTNILKASGHQHLPICIEPGLFEWISWYQDGLPVWLTVQELHDWGFNINLNYKPLITVDELSTKRETSEQYYMRNYFITQNILKNCFEQGGNVLLLGHAATLDTCTRQLIGQSPRNVNGLVQITHRVPYCGCVVVQEDNEGKWCIVNPPFPTLVHGNNMRFDWKILTNS